MGIVITVDLATSTPSDIARAAKFMLEFIGYQDPSVAQNASNQTARDSWVGSQSFPEATSGLISGIPRGSLGEEIHDTHGSRELDADAAKLAAMGGDPGPTAATVFAAPPTGASNPGTQGEQDEAAGYSLAPPVPVPHPQGALPPPPPGIEVDSQGVPWDTRIHAGSRAKIADGTWRQRRNLDPAVFKAVMDELRATMNVERRAPTPPAPPAPQQVFAPHPPVPPIPVISHPEVAPPAPAAVVAQPVVPPVPFADSAAPPAPPTSPIPIVPGLAGAATGASPGSAPTFPQLMQRITAAFTAKTLDQPRIIAAVQKVGLTSLPMLASRPDLVGDVATELGIAL